MDRLKSPRSKRDWARDHLTTLNTKLRAFVAEHDYQAVRENDPKLGLDVMRMKIADKPPLPDEFSHRIGEFATALRASLDHLVWALMSGAPKHPIRSSSQSLTIRSGMPPIVLNNWAGSSAVPSN